MFESRAHPIVIVVPDDLTGDEIRAHAEGANSRLHRSVVVQTAQGQVAEQCRALRRDAGSSVALGAVVQSASEEIEALASGADEAMRVEHLSGAEILLLLDRVLVRAASRRETERMREAYARSDKLAALGTLVAGVGHEINNPLSAVMLSVAAVKATVTRLLEAAWELRRAANAGEGLSPEQTLRLANAVQRGSSFIAPELLDEVMSASETIADVVRDLRTFARAPDEGAPTSLNVNELVEQVLRLVGSQLNVRGVVIERDYGSDVPELVAPRSRLVQVLSNLLINAAHAVSEVDRPQHRVRVTTRGDEEGVAISVSDTGPGIAPDVVQRIFDPFFTTKRAEMGTGLGLSLARSIVVGLGGDLLVDSVLGEGATFVCLLPLPTEEQRREAMRHGSVGDSSQKRALCAQKNVLVFDEDERVLRAYARYLGVRHKLVMARDGREASELLLSGSSADVILAELSSAEMKGPEFARWLGQRDLEPRPRLVFVAASSDSAELLRWAAREGHELLHKPIRPEALEALLD